MKAFRRRDDVSEVIAHQCAFGQMSQDKLGPGLVLKPARFLSNAEEILIELNKTCANGQPGVQRHRHVHLVEGRAAAAAVYPPGLVAAILRGLT